jgi:ATP/maltotriose-dependent transcriptional regulator MalT
MLDGVAGRSRTPRLVGRQTELSSLVSALDDARDGKSRLLLVGGEAGVGKTRLIEELVLRADDAKALIGGCVDLGDDALPFAPFAAALREPMRAAGVDDLVELAAGGSDDRRRLYEGVADLLEQISIEQPVVLVVEDLHWADRSTRELLAFLGRALRDVRVLIIATYRTDEIHRSHPLRPFVAELSRSVQRIELERLDFDDVTDLLQDLLGREPSSSEATRLYERSEGNPFYLEELTACPTDFGLPQSLRELMLVRVERLAPPTQTVLHIASIIGTEVPHNLLAAVASGMSVDDDTLTLALRDAVDSSLLVMESEEGYSFRHSLLRESLHDDLLPGEHTRLHAEVARTLADNPGLVDHQRRDAEVAHHWYSAHDLPKALTSAVRAADGAKRINAYAEQLRLLERILELWAVVPDAAELTGTTEFLVVSDASLAAGRAGDSDRAVAFSDRAVRIAETDGDPELLARALNRRGKWRVHQDSDAALADVRRSLEILPPGSSDNRARSLDALASVLMLRGDHDEAIPVARQAAAMAREFDAPNVELSALITLGMLLVDNAEVDEGLSVAREALARAEATDGQLMLARALTNLSHGLSGLGRHREAEAAARRGLRTIKDIGLWRTFSAVLSGNTADPLLALGRLDDAQDVLNDAERAVGIHIDGSIYLLQLQGSLSLAREDVEGAEQALKAIDETRWVYGQLPQDRLPVDRLRAAVSLRRGELDAAYEHSMQPMRGEIADGHARYYWPLLLIAAETTDLMAKRQPDAERLAQQVQEVTGAAQAQPVAGASGQAWSTTVEALLASAQGFATSETWIEAASTYAKVEEPIPQGMALLRAAELAATEGDRSAASALVREADDVASLMATPNVLRTAVDAMARRVRVDLGAGAAGAADDSADAFGLTEREREVLRRVAAGRSNRQIADELFISPKTASVHVSNILAKLGVSGRGEAAAFAHRNGLD